MGGHDRIREAARRSRPLRLRRGVSAAVRASHSPDREVEEGSWVVGQEPPAGLGDVVASATRSRDSDGLEALDERVKWHAGGPAELPHTDEVWLDLAGFELRDVSLGKPEPAGHRFLGKPRLLPDFAKYQPDALLQAFLVRSHEGTVDAAL